MYNWEIDEVFKKYNYKPPASVYIAVCGSPQVRHVKCDGEWIDIWSADGAHWRVSPHPDE